VTLLALLAGCGSSGEEKTSDYRSSSAYQREAAELRHGRARERRIEQEFVEQEVSADEGGRKVQADPAPTKQSAPNPLAEKVRKESREFCSIFPQAKMAREYRVVDDPGAVASAYADGYRPELQGVAKAGCIEGVTR